MATQASWATWTWQGWAASLGHLLGSQAQRPLLLQLLLWLPNHMAAWVQQALVGPSPPSLNQGVSSSLSSLTQQATLQLIK